MRNKKFLQLPAGEYYIGDIGYAFDKMWQEILDKTNYFHLEPFENVVTFIGEHGTAAAYTVHGDGTYTDGIYKYPVDSGAIGVMPVQLLELEKILTVEKIREQNIGRVEKFFLPFVVHIEDGIFRFGHIEIDTNYADTDFEIGEWDDE